MHTYKTGYKNYKSTFDYYEMVGKDFKSFCEDFWKMATTLILVSNFTMGLGSGLTGTDIAIIKYLYTNSCRNILFCGSLM